MQPVLDAKAGVKTTTMNEVSLRSSKNYQDILGQYMGLDQMRYQQQQSTERLTSRSPATEKVVRHTQPEQWGESIGASIAASKESLLQMVGERSMKGLTTPRPSNDQGKFTQAFVYNNQFLPL